MDVELQTKNQNQQKETATQQLRAADTQVGLQRDTKAYEKAGMY